MKKKLSILVLFHLVFTFIQVSLISKISFIGKVGIAMMYKEYKFLRSFPKTYAYLILTQLLVIGVLTYTHQRLSRRRHYMTCGVVFLLALVGLWYTYNDFVHNYSHRLLKERFHLGFYLFWIGMMISAVFFALLPATKPKQLPVTDLIPPPADQAVS
ncbi:MAG: hypothetical protein EOO09_00235 [Chitinophagaceae bacterium]|nr:MAG: hypothetical protein EOO09_00235 [Chitinophagaceae bacterium]